MSDRKSATGFALAFIAQCDAILSASDQKLLIRLFDQAVQHMPDLKHGPREGGAEVIMFPGAKHEA